jgi:hypothetical protein
MGHRCFTKRQGLLLEDVTVLNSNAHPHTNESYCQLNLKHPLYCPDLAPSYCHLFGQLKDSLRRHHFISDQTLKAKVHAWIITQPNSVL